MDEYYKRCLEKKRLIYNYNLWDTFFSAFTPILIILLLSLAFFSILFQNIDNINENNWIKISVSIFGIFILVILIILYYRNGKFMICKGVTRSNNKTKISNFLKNEKFIITLKENDVIIVDVKVWNNYHNRRELIILFDENLVYCNCTTYVTIWEHEANMENFRSPFYWFSNRKIEKDLNRYLKSYI